MNETVQPHRYFFLCKQAARQGLQKIKRTLLCLRNLPECLKSNAEEVNCSVQTKFFNFGFVTYNHKRIYDMWQVCYTQQSVKHNSFNFKT